MTFVIKILMYALIGCTLATAGVNWDDWQLYAILVFAYVIELCCRSSAEKSFRVDF